MKAILSALTILLIFIVPNFAFAASPSFSIRPGSGKVILNKNFTLDLLIDSEGKNVSLARAVIKYNPTYVTIQKADRNSSLFCTYPEDEQSIDNENGLLMVTGFCQSGVGAPYKTVGDADVFARVTFRAQKVGDTTISWEYTGEDVPFNSVIMKDGSPPSNLLASKPSSALFNVVRGVSSTPTPQPETPNTPNTGITLSIGLVVSGTLLLFMGYAYSKLVDNRQKGKLRTVVKYDNKS